MHWDMTVLAVVENDGLQFGPLLTGVGGGLALFLYGMRKMTDALKVVAGARMKSFLGRITTNRFTAAFAGAGVTAVIQSSSITTVLVVGFITSGLLTLSQSIGVILGANIGTTVTAQIIAFKITKYALALIAAGFIIEVGARKERNKQYGIVIMGLGLIFFGMDLMSTAASPLQSYQPFMELMQEMRNPVWGILIGAVFTGLVQSSSATTGVVIVMATEGLVSLEAGIALIFGANVGTCITALIAGIGRPREALQAAVAHVIFNLAGVALWLPFIFQFAEAVRVFSPVYEGVEGTLKLSLETPRQIANAHTLFNVGNAIIFIWFATPLAWLVTKMVPPKPKSSEGAGVPIYLDDFFLQQPSVALDRARLEIGRLGEIVLHMVDRSYHAPVEGSEGEIDDLRIDEHCVDELHGAIISYLGKLSLCDLVEPQPRLIYEYIATANSLENAADICGKDLARSGGKRIDAQFEISNATRKKLQELHRLVLDSGKKALKAFAEGDVDLGKKVTATKRRISRLANDAQAHLLKRLVAEEPERIPAFRIESNIVEDYKRLHTLFRRIARTVKEIEEETKVPEENRVEPVGQGDA